MHKIVWRTERRKIKDLIPLKGNPRKATEKQVKGMDESLGKFNVAIPLVINRDNTIIGGHFIRKRLEANGTDEVDVRVPDRLLTTEEDRELNLRLNKAGGSWDYELLKVVDEELLIDVGFDPRELDDIKDLEPGLVDVNELPLVSMEAKAHLGEIYQMGEHRLMCGDSTNPDQIKKLLNGEKLSMVFTDPPYNVNYSGTGAKTGNTIKNDNLSEADFSGFIGKVFSNLKDSMVPGAVYYICSGWSSYPVFHRALQQNGFYRSGVIIWVKDNASLGWNDFRYKHEWILVGKSKLKESNAVSILYGWKDGPHLFRDTRDEYDVWEVPRKHSGLYEHPTEKPVWLVEKALANSSERYSTVGDLFCGSGSTLIACQRLKRKALLMELDPKYVDVAIERWERFTGLKAKRLCRGS